MAALKVLAVAVANGRVGYVLMNGTKLQDWSISVKATKSTSQLVEWMQKLINDLRPDVVVTEKIAATCRKGPRTKTSIAALA